MEEYRVFTKNPLNKIGKIFLHKALGFALEEIAKDIEKTSAIITKQNILDNLPMLTYKGLKIMRSKGQKNKQIYELYHGCILAAFLNGMEPNSNHDVCYPEDDSCDFQIVKYPRIKEPDFKTIDNKKIYKNVSVLKIELAELIKLEDLVKIISDKSKFTHRILLISIAFQDEINFQEISDQASKINHNNFKNIWFIGQTNHPEDKSRLCYFIAELVKHKKIFPLFELTTDWSKIEDEASKALS